MSVLFDQLQDDGLTSQGVMKNLKPSDLLYRLSRAKDTARDPQLIILDLRESSLFTENHILTAQSYSCHTKMMARRAIACWDSKFAFCNGCPAPPMPSNTAFQAQVSRLDGIAIVLYDQRSENLPVDYQSPIGYFVSTLINKGNTIYFLEGGFTAFARLQSSDFIDRGPPMSSKSNMVLIRPSGTQIAAHSPDATDISLPPTPHRMALRSDVLTLCSAAPTEEEIVPEVAHQSYSSPFVDFNSLETREASRLKGPSLLSKPLNERQMDSRNATISKVLPFLYLGNARDALDLELLGRLKITHIINVTDSVPMPFQQSPRLHYLHLPATDSAHQDLLPAFDQAIGFIDEAKKNGGTVLVHCQAGVSRSVSVVVSYLLHTNRNLSVVQALEIVNACRPAACPNIYFLAQLQQYYEQLHTLPTCKPSSTKLPEKNRSRWFHRVGSNVRI